MADRGALRRSNFFRDTMRDPDAHTAPDAAISDALLVVGSNIDAQAKADGRQLSTAQRERALSVAQRLLRALPRDQLYSISASSGFLKSITDQSLAIAPVNDPRSPAALAAAHTQDHGAAVDRGVGLARVFGSDFERSDRVGSSSRYDGMGSGDRLSQSDLQNMAEARSMAHHLGMPWAANNRELLRLGPSAVRTLHDAGVQRQTFERMTSERVGVRARTAVSMASWARRQNLTPEQTNKLMNSTSDLHENLSRGLPTDERRAVQRDLDDAAHKFYSGANSPEARQELRDRYMRHAHTPEQRRQVHEHMHRVEEAQRHNTAATARRNSDVRTAAAATADANRRVAGEDDAFAAPSATGRPQGSQATQPNAVELQAGNRQPSSRQGTTAASRPTQRTP